MNPAGNTVLIAGGTSGIGRAQPNSSTSRGAKPPRSPTFPTTENEDVPHCHHQP